VVQKSRQDVIMQHLKERGTCSYEDLVAITKVSNMTVRRDVDKLAVKKLVIKTLGGVAIANAPHEFYESQLTERLSLNHQEKELIAKEAIKYVKTGTTIFIDGGTTCLEFAKLLAKTTARLTVVTNSALTYIELTQGTNTTITCIGGQHDPQSFCLVGPMAEEDCQRYFIDQAFFSTKSFFPAEGTFESSMPTFRIKKIVAKQSAEVVLLVDHSKFGQRALCKVLDISQIRTVITDDKTPSEDIALLRQCGKKVYVVNSAVPYPEETTCFEESRSDPVKSGTYISR
jgi:DeoR family transcriptional regulator, fructose operon transcriptional repressor